MPTLMPQHPSQSLQVPTRQHLCLLKWCAKRLPHNLLRQSFEQHVHWTLSSRLLRRRQLQNVCADLSSWFRCRSHRQKMQVRLHSHSWILRLWPAESLCPALSCSLLQKQSDLQMHSWLHHISFDVQVWRNSLMRLKLPLSLLRLHSQSYLSCLLSWWLVCPAIYQILRSNL